SDIRDTSHYLYPTGRRKRLDCHQTAQPTPGPFSSLSDLKRDPGEFRNVAAQYPALVENLRHRLEARFAATHPEPGLNLDSWLRPRDAK
ncbi:MAG: hypothetical protein ACK5TN_17375, partial [Acidobacteriota bacterium]